MVKEPGLKLFGRNILLADKGRTAAGEYSGESSVESSNGGAVDCGGSLDVGRGRKGKDGVKAGGEEKQGRADELQKHQEEEEEEMEEDIYEDNDQDLNQNPDESPHPTAKPGGIPKTPSMTDGPPKALKKPEKILPCPRCKSPDTKFCYFNNYNVNQPRHLCKACQRYWTDGGTMRNVPVGSGRRKNKSHFSGGRPGPNGGVLSFACGNGSALPWPFPAFCPPCCYHSTPGWDEGFSGPVRMGKCKRSREGEGSERGWMWSSVEAGFDSLRREVLVKALQPRGEMKKSSVLGSSLLQANPAAFSRSMSFRERV